MSDTQPMILYSRSHVTTDWVCPRKRFWNYEWKGKGIVSSHTSLELFLGTVLHDGLAAIAEMHKSGAVDIDLLAETARKQIIDSLTETSSGEVDQIDFAFEQASLIEGLLRGFYIHAWPRLIAAYPVIIAVEKEVTFNHDGLTFMSRPDLILADKEGNLFYIEYKSTSSKKEGWVNSWATAVQLHSTCAAIEQTLDEKVTAVIVQGLYKGFESYGKQSSPMCYAYRRKGNPPFTHDEVRYDWKAGFTRTPVWEMQGGVKSWVNGMPEQVLGDQFPQVPPIFPSSDLIQTFFRQRAGREQEIQLANSMIEGADEEAQKFLLDAAFQQRFDQCRPYFGRPCQYLPLCFGHVPDPLKEGYVVREAHHQLESEQNAK